LTANIEVPVEMVDKCIDCMKKGKLIIRLLGSWKNGNKLSGNNVVCFRYEYVVSNFCSDYARFGATAVVRRA